MKFGGTSVADAERLKRAARRIVAKREAGHRVVAVLSARGQGDRRADRRRATRSRRVPDPREMDMLLSTGERVSCALCAMAINDLGHRAISLTGSQAGIVTDTSHTKARILDVRADRIFARARRGRDRARRRLPGRVDGEGRHDARPRRLGHDRRRARRRRRRRGLRDLHRRRRASSAPTRGSSRTRASCRSSPSRRCSRCRRRAPASCSCAASSTPATTACASTADRASTRRRVPFVVAEEETMEQPADHRRHPLARRGPRHAHGRAGHARRRRPRSTTALADGERERRHDHPGRAGDRGPAGRHVVHGPARRPAHGARPRSTRIASELGIDASRPTRRWGRCRSSARE